MKTEYDVLDETLLPTLQPAIQAFGLPQQIINATIVNRHKQAAAYLANWEPSDATQTPSLHVNSQEEDPRYANSSNDMIAIRDEFGKAETSDTTKVALSYAGIANIGMGLGSNVLDGISWIAKVRPNARQAAIDGASSASGAFGRALKRELPNVSDLIDLQDAQQIEHLRAMSERATDPTMFANMLNTPAGRSVLPANVVDRIVNNPADAARIHAAGAFSARAGQNADLLRDAATYGIDQNESLVTRHPLSLASSALGAGAFGAGIVDFATAKEEKSPWYQDPRAAAAAAGVAGTALGVGAVMFAPPFGGKPSVLGAGYEPHQKIGGLGTMFASGASAVADILNRRLRGSVDFGRAAASKFPDMAPEKLQEVADAFTDHQRNSLLGRSSRALGAAATVGSVVSGGQAYLAKQERDRQREDFERKLPAMVAGATGAGVMLGGLGNHLTQRAMDKVLPTPTPLPKLASIARHLMR
jgi:hypothetical protein